MYCYRFPDEQSWLAAAATEGLLVEGEESPTLLAYTHTHAIDVVGTIIGTPGTYDENGDELTPPVPLPGWHINVQGIAPEAWDQFLTYVYQPRRIFAGQPGPVPA